MVLVTIESGIRYDHVVDRMVRLVGSLEGTPEPAELVRLQLAAEIWDAKRWSYPLWNMLALYDVPCSITVRQSIKPGCSVMAVYRFEYLSLKAGLVDLLHDFREGRVEKVMIGDVRIADGHMAVLEASLCDAAAEI